MTQPILKIDLDYPLNPRPRYELGKHPHARLDSILNRNRDKYRATLDQFMALSEKLAQIPRLTPSSRLSPREAAQIPQYFAKAKQGDPEAIAWLMPMVHEVARDTTPCWLNGYIPGLDGVSLYAFVTLRAPSLYLEIGSGNSTKFVRQAILDHQLDTRIVSIDPHPRSSIDDICDEVIRQPLEDCDLEVFQRLGSGDMLFIDGSHRCFMGSDATIFFLEVLPDLPLNVLVGIHDIFLPYDYPAEWVDRAYSEQYLLAAYLLAGSNRFEIELPCKYVSLDPELSEHLRPLWNALPNVLEQTGSGFWLRTS